MTRFACRCWLMVLAILSVCACITCSAGAENRRALLVGINRYEPTAGKAPQNAARDRFTFADLKGPVNDVEGMQAVLITRWQFPQEGITLLKDRTAGREQILGALRRLIEQSAAGDVLLFYYAGHGSQMDNSLSPEADKKDETLVPADAAAGASDIRDKELARLFNQAVDKGVFLTAIYDSCHSGSILRGPRNRSLRELRQAEGDARDPGPEKRPEENGALVFSACQDYEKAAEQEDGEQVVHGLFTRALLDTLQTVDLSTPSDTLLSIVAARVRAHGGGQVPVLGGTAARRKMTLFGSRTTGAGRTTVSGRPVAGGVELLGGLAAGLRKGCELVRTVPPTVRVKVTGLKGLTLCTAEVIEGPVGGVKAGDLFTLDRWAAPNEPNLRVYMAPATMSVTALREAAQTLAPLRSAPGITWIADPAAAGATPGSRSPAAASPLAVVSWNGDQWEIVTPSNGVGAPLGAKPDAAGLPAKLSAAAGGPARVIAVLPPPKELRAQLQLGAGTPNDAIEIVKSPEQADYVLVGREEGGQLQYAWITGKSFRAAARGGMEPGQAGYVVADDQLSTLPDGTAWVPLGGGNEALRNAAGELEEKALRLGTVRAWLTLTGPPGSGAFPYRLVVQETKTERVVPGPTLPRRGDERAYRLALQKEPTVPEQSIIRRFVYVFVLDRSGASTVMYPPLGGVENRLPIVAADGKLPELFPLQGSEFDTADPFGDDTYLMLTTQEPLHNPQQLAFEGVRGGPAGGNPLETLLYSTGSRSRSVRTAVPTDWSIQRVTLRSVAAGG